MERTRVSPGTMDAPSPTILIVPGKDCTTLEVTEQSQLTGTLRDIPTERGKIGYYLSHVGRRDEQEYVRAILGGNNIVTKGMRYEEWRAQLHKSGCGEKPRAEITHGQVGDDDDDPTDTAGQQRG
jgi:hypothetical protein